MEYDSSVIQRFASRLYSQATLILFLATFLGIVALGLPGYFVGRAVGLLAGSVIGGAVGFAIGDMLALALKLKAQSLLCQVQIEIHTRQAAAILAKKAWLEEQARKVS